MSSRGIVAVVSAGATLDQPRRERCERVAGDIVLTPVEVPLHATAHATHHAREQRLQLVAPWRWQRDERGPLFVGRRPREDAVGPDAVEMGRSS